MKCPRSQILHAFDALTSMLTPMNSNWDWSVLTLNASCMGRLRANRSKMFWFVCVCLCVCLACSDWVLRLECLQGTNTH